MPSTATKVPMHPHRWSPPGSGSVSRATTKPHQRREVTAQKKRQPKPMLPAAADDPHQHGEETAAQKSEYQGQNTHILRFNSISKKGRSGNPASIRIMLPQPVNRASYARGFGDTFCHQKVSTRKAVIGPERQLFAGPVGETEFAPLLRARSPERLPDGGAGQRRGESHRIEIQHEEGIFRLQQLRTARQHLADVVLQHPLFAVGPAPVSRRGRG